ncbi:MAG: hypothetical protein U5N55_00995 [Cypionkella sp.]|nr:hypothetical protein [Cypionkella sp.]
MSQSLWPWPLFAAMLAAAGLPIYIHAPKFFPVRWAHGVSVLGGLGWGFGPAAAD